MPIKPQGRFNDHAIAVNAHGQSCCPHVVKGPAIQGSSNVFVNNQAALRVDNQGMHTACCGSNHWVAKTGSATVFINNQPAHRLGDSTQHCGGMGILLEGSHNVFVGGPSISLEELKELEEKKKELEDKKKRLVERKQLIEQGRAKANDPSNDLTEQEREKLEEACNSLERDMKAVEHAKLAESINTGKDDPFGERLASLPEESRKVVWEDPCSGFRAALYRSKVNGDMVLALAGSDVPVLKNLEDWIKTDISIMSGGNPSQLKQAVALAKMVHSVLGANFSVAGQSLGGALASVAGPSVGVGGSIFNALGVPRHTLNGYDLTCDKICSLITRYDIGDSLTWLQEKFPLLNKFFSDALGKSVRLPIPKGVGLFKRHGDFCDIIDGIEGQKKISEETIKIILQK